MANEIRSLLKELAAKGEHDIVRRIYQMNLIHTMQLINSIKADAIVNENGRDGIRIQYNYVSVFLETGTGKGQKLHQKGPRTPKLFISPVVRLLKAAMVEKILNISSDELMNTIKLEFSKPPRE